MAKKPAKAHKPPKVLDKPPVNKPEVVPAALTEIHGQMKSQLAQMQIELAKLTKPAVPGTNPPYDRLADEIDKLKLRLSYMGK